MKEEFGVEGIEVLKRRTYKKEERKVTEECRQCRGKGRIFRVVDCGCGNGCRLCSNSRIMINPKWR